MVLRAKCGCGRLTDVVWKADQSLVNVQAIVQMHDLVFKTKRGETIKMVDFKEFEKATAFSIKDLAYGDNRPDDAVDDSPIEMTDKHASLAMCDECLARVRARDEAAAAAAAERLAARQELERVMQARSDAYDARTEVNAAALEANQERESKKVEEAKRYASNFDASDFVRVEDPDEISERLREAEAAFDAWPTDDETLRSLAKAVAGSPSIALVGAWT